MTGINFPRQAARGKVTLAQQTRAQHAAERSSASPTAKHIRLAGKP